MRKLQFEPLIVHCFEEEVFHLPKHSHTYYELIYIFKGCGNHQINHIIHCYKPGDLFLISPEDEHYFDIKKSTRFCFIKFTDSYFNNNKHLSPDMLLHTSPQDIMRNPLLKEIKLQFDEPCKTILKKTIENIVDYNSHNNVASSPLIFFQLLSLLGLIREASARLNVRIDKGLPDKEDMISYIHLHIYAPEKVRVKNVAEHFNISPNYFSAYFKRNFDISYRDYINEYRFKLIEKRIRSKQSSFKQIANEFGFADESHFSNYFKQITNMRPSAYKATQ